MTDEVTPSALDLAQKRLAKACMGVFSNPAGAAVSAFVNSLLTAARVDALSDYLMKQPTNASWSNAEWLEHLTVQHTGFKADELEKAASAPKLVSSNGSALIHQS